MRVETEYAVAVGTASARARALLLSWQRGQAQQAEATRRRSQRLGDLDAQLRRCGGCGGWLLGEAECTTCAVLAIRDGLVRCGDHELRPGAVNRCLTCHARAELARRRARGVPPARRVRRRARTLVS